MSTLDRQLEAARGWLLLGNAEEAGRELDNIDTAHEHDPRVLKIRARVFQSLEQWKQLQTVAGLLCNELPRDPQWMLSLAMATRHLYGPEQAIGILMETVEVFADKPGAYYDLACCEAVLGNLDLARGWLRDAISLDGGFREKERQNPDLAPLWSEL